MRERKSLLGLISEMVLVLLFLISIVIPFGSYIIMLEGIFSFVGIIIFISVIIIIYWFRLMILLINFK